MAAGEPEARAPHAPLPEEEGEEEEETRSRGPGSSSEASGARRAAEEAGGAKEALALRPESRVSRPSSPFALLLSADAGAGVWDRLLAWVAQLQSGLRLALARDEARRTSLWDLEKMASSPWPRADAFLGQLGSGGDRDAFQKAASSDPGSPAGELE
ncbi:hypothetical protein H632_c5401p0, partial [Helicosporidium sp. ATCC 50920]